MKPERSLSALADQCATLLMMHSRTFHKKDKLNLLAFLGVKHDTLRRGAEAPRFNSHVSYSD